MSRLRCQDERSPSKTGKHITFASGPIGDKGVKYLPGIGETYGARLEKAGFHKAQSVVNKFAVEFEKDEKRFKQWLKDTCEANAKSQKECYDGLSEWCDQHL